MNEVLQEFYAAGERDVTAPSGIVYTIRPARQSEVYRILGAVPAILGKTSEAAVERGAQEMARQAAVNAELVRASILKMAFRGKVSTEIPPADDLPANDVSFLLLEIDKPIATEGPAAEDARGILPVS